MGKRHFFPPHAHHLYSQKLRKRIVSPIYAGSFTAKEAEEKGMRLAIGKEGLIEEGNCIVFYWLVDLEDGVIADAAFQVYGQSALIGAADIACELLIRKNYDQARRISAELLDKHVRDSNQTEMAFPPDTFAHLNLVIGAIDEAADKCMDIPLADEYVTPPMEFSGERREYPGWDALTLVQKMSVLNQVLTEEVRPYVQLDAGDVYVTELRDEQVIIAYQGSCTSCYSSIGATLSAIDTILKMRVHPSLRAVPDMSLLELPH